MGAFSKEEQLQSSRRERTYLEEAAPEEIEVA